MSFESALSEQLKEILPRERIKARPIDLHSYARDASFYRLIPQAVVQPVNELEIKALFEFSRSSNMPLVFRAAGTSLSGQAITDSILVEITSHWQDFRFDQERDTIELEPGLIGGQVNRNLAPYGRKIGPDPASLDACMIGGIVANNASGMCCGVKDNAYHTMSSVRFILPNGHTYDSQQPGADDELKQQDPELYKGLLDLRSRVLEDEKLHKRIRDKYTRKNTQGYALNAFIDYDRPIDILSHLLIGSEGTLAFISKVRLQTLVDERYKSAALLLFKDIRSAVEAVDPLDQAGAKALELMDRAALRSIQDDPGMPAHIKTLPEGAAALLCEFQAADEAMLKETVVAGLLVLKDLGLIHPASFTSDETTRLQYWKLRKGMLPSVSAVRKSGTTVLTEDICFRREDLADATLELQQLMETHGYEDAIIFGHAKEGNLHFVVSQTFEDAAGRAQYEHFMSDLVKMTVGTYDGALKAEHGTGRNMAPFLATEWGEVAVGIMRDLKALIDPDYLLNPGVIINDDPESHLQHIKPNPSIEAAVDMCIECGFCETWCPSQGLTMTPRQRIATWREIHLLQQEGDEGRRIAQAILDDYQHASVDTCAVDGLCALGCPVKIDTGDLTRHLRQERHGFISKRVAGWTVRYFSFVVEMIRLGLNVVTPMTRFIGSQRVVNLSRRIHGWTKGWLPIWHVHMPTGGKGLPLVRIKNTDAKDEVVYFASCINRGMHKTPGEAHTLSTPAAFNELMQEAGIHPIYPDHLEELCCGTPYASKGFDQAYKWMAERTVRSLWKTSQGGKLPVVVDTSPCTYKMQQYDSILKGEYLQQWQSLKLVDIIAFLNDTLIPRLDIKQKAQKVILHPTCSTQKMGLENKMLGVARACAEQAIIPQNTGCCGFAGDRGLLVPELTEHATQAEAREVREHIACDGYYSTSRTCEMGMSDATDLSYSSLIHLVHKAVFNSP